MKSMTNKYLKLTIILIFYLQLISCKSNKDIAKIEQGNNKTRIKYYSNKPKNGYYRVRKGDTLYKISLKYNLSINTLKKINNIDNENKIETGELIKISTKNLKNNKTNSKSINNTRLADIQNNKSISNLSNVKFTWPVKGNVINNFNGKTNKGIDILSKEGEVVGAAADGIVLHADYIKGFGKSIIISHDSKNKVLTVYGNLSNILINTGKKVKAKEKIALIGSKDNKPELHFEIRNNNIALNPLNYLSK